MLKTLTRQVIPILLAIGLLWYVLKDIPLNELTHQFVQANPYWVALALFLIILYHVVRAIRWQLPLQALGYQPSLFRTTVAMLAGALASMIIPGAGELTRCGTLQRTDGVPLAQGIGSVVAERVIDLGALVIVIIFTLLLEFKRVGKYIIELVSPFLSRFSISSQSNSVLVIGFVVCLLTFSALYWLLRNGKLRQHPLMIRVMSIVRDIKRGFLSIQQLQHPALFVLYTFISYVLILLINYVLFFASPLTQSLPPTAALTILMVSSLGGLAVPTQGGLGIYHFLVSRALVLYGMSLTDGVIAATFLHGIQVGFSLFLSSLSFLIIPILISRKSHPNQLAADHQPLSSEREI